jgi:hypothetical protein
MAASMNTHNTIEKTQKMELLSQKLRYLDQLFLFERSLQAAFKRAIAHAQQMHAGTGFLIESCKI